MVRILQNLHFPTNLYNYWYDSYPKTPSPTPKSCSSTDVVLTQLPLHHPLPPTQNQQLMNYWSNTLYTSVQLKIIWLGSKNNVLTLKNMYNYEYGSYPNHIYHPHKTCAEMVWNQKHLLHPHKLVQLLIWFKSKRTFSTLTNLNNYWYGGNPIKHSALTQNVYIYWYGLNPKTPSPPLKLVKLLIWFKSENTFFSATNLYIYWYGSILKTLFPTPQTRTTTDMIQIR